MAGKRFADFTTCNPISLVFDIIQVHNDENFLSCRAQRMPEDLNAPGFLDAAGFLHYREVTFLDLSQQDTVMKVFDLCEHDAHLSHYC